MAEPAAFAKAPQTIGWRCVLCDEIVPGPSVHYCLAEARIREIIREEITRPAQTVGAPLSE